QRAADVEGVLVALMELDAVVEAVLERFGRDVREVVPLLTEQEAAELTALRRDVVGERRRELVRRSGPIGDLISDERRRRIAARPHVDVVDARGARVAVEEEHLRLRDPRGAEDAD